MKEKTTFLAKASMMLFAVLFSLAANSAETAGVTLPYEYGFENNDLASEGWILQGATSNQTTFHSNPARTGSYGFQIAYNEQNCYLISPLLNAGENGVTVSFWHKDYSNTYGDEQFQVGYTTDESATDASTFTYGDIVTSQVDWAEYKGNFPADTKRIAIKYVYGDHFYLFLDDFSFTEFSGVEAPTGLKVSYEGGTEATVSWASEDDLFDIDVNGTVTEDVENPYTLTVAYETEYTVKVRAKKDGKTSEWSDPVSFTTSAQFDAPTNVAAVSGPTTATVTWAGNATSYNLRYGEIVPGPTAKIILTADDVWGDGSGYQMLLDADATAYGTIIPETGALTTSGDVDASIYAEFEYKAPENADGALATANMVSGSSVTIEIPAGTYDWCITNPTPGDKMWIASGNGTIGGRKDDFVFEGGKVYEFHVYLGGTNDAVDLTISPIIDESTIAWTTVNNVTSPYTISGLTTETLYAVQVQGVYTDGQSQWVGTSFTTLSSNPVPYNIAADLAADGAKLTWEGDGEDYVVRYRVPSTSEATFFEDFEDGLPEDWTTVDADEDGKNWTVSSDIGNFTCHSGSVCMVSASYDDSALTPDNWLITPKLDLGGTMRVWLRGQDASWAGEHFAIYLAPVAEIADVSDFTITLVPETVATGEYVEYTADLSAYAGQQGYIAIRHFNITDMFYLNVDDFALYEEVPAGEWVEIAATDAVATISGLATNNTYEYQIKSIKDDSESEWSESGEFSLVTLDCDGDNEDLIAKFDGKFAHVTLANRTFYKDGTWNSIYLPFDLTEEEFNKTVLADGELRTLTSIGAEDERIKLNFDDAMGMYASYGYPDFIAGFPYIIKWATGSNVVNPEFAGVTISAAQYGTSAKNEDESIEISFGGTYTAYEFDAEETSVLFIGENSKLYYPQAGATIGATRGYFILDGVTAGESNGVKFYTNLDGDDATGIANISVKESGEWYDLSGRKLAGKPMQKGIYVNGGRKVTIK